VAHPVEEAVKVTTVPRACGAGTLGVNDAVWHDDAVSRNPEYPYAS